MRYHIVKVSLVYQGEHPMPERDHARAGFQRSILDLEPVSFRLSGEKQQHGLFLVEHDALLQWMASSPIYYKEIQIQIFSLQDQEGQLVGKGVGQDCGKPERYQIVK